MTLLAFFPSSAKSSTRRCAVRRTFSTMPGVSAHSTSEGSVWSVIFLSEWSPYSLTETSIVSVPSVILMILPPFVFKRPMRPGHAGNQSATYRTAEFGITR